MKSEGKLLQDFSVRFKTQIEDESRRELLIQFCQEGSGEKNTAEAKKLDNENCINSITANCHPLSHRSVPYSRHPAQRHTNIAVNSPHRPDVHHPSLRLNTIT